MALRQTDRQRAISQANRIRPKRTQRSAVGSRQRLAAGSRHADKPATVVSSEDDDTPLVLIAALDECPCGSDRSAFTVGHGGRLAVRVPVPHHHPAPSQRRPRCTIQMHDRWLANGRGGVVAHARSHPARTAARRPADGTAPPSSAAQPVQSSRAAPSAVHTDRTSESSTHRARAHTTRERDARRQRQWLDRRMGWAALGDRGARSQRLCAAQ